MPFLIKLFYNSVVGKNQIKLHTLRKNIGSFGTFLSRLVLFGTLSDKETHCCMVPHKLMTKQRRLKVCRFRVNPKVSHHAINTLLSNLDSWRGFFMHKGS